MNCGISDCTITRLAEVVQQGSLAHLENMTLSDCYITKNSDTMLIKALKMKSKKMKKLGIKTRRSSMTPSCVKLQTHSRNSNLHTSSNSHSHYSVYYKHCLNNILLPLIPSSNELV